MVHKPVNIYTKL